MRKLEVDEVKDNINNLAKEGYTVIKKYLSEYEVEQSLIKVRTYWEKSGPLEKEHTSDKAKTVYGLETKDKFFLNFLTNQAVKEILINFINDPYFGVLPKDHPNYHIGYYLARSSSSALLTHLDSYIPYSGNHPIIMQCLFALEKQTLSNGCTYVVPQSHRSGEYPNQTTKNENEKNILSDVGDLVLWDARIWHGARKNETRETRWGLIVTLMRHWIKPRLDSTRNITPAYYKSLNNEEKALLGFCSIPPHDLNSRIKPRMGLDQLYEDPLSFYTNSTKN